MADRFVHGNKPLDSTSDDSRSSVVQNDQIITKDDKLIVENQKLTFENRHQVGGGIIDLRQNAVDNTGSLGDTGTSCDNVADRAKKAVKDKTDIDHIVNCQDKEDRNKATAENTNKKSTEQHCPSVSQVVDAISTNHVIDRENSAFQDSLQTKKTSQLVDRQKLTLQDDTRATGVSQNVQIITEDDQAVSKQENKAHECDSTSTNQNAFNRKQKAVGNSVTLAHYVVENQHQIGEGIILGTSSENVGDLAKKTGEDHQPARGKINRQQLTVTDRNLTDHVVNCPNFHSFGIVDRNKATVEDTNGTSSEHSTKQQCPSVSQVVDATSTDRVLEREISAFQDIQLKKTSNLADHQKRAVEDDTPTTSIRQLGAPNTTQITGNQVNQLVDCSVQLRNVDKMVNLQKRKVENTTTSAQVTVTTKIIGEQPNHHLSSDTKSVKAGNMVDCEKETVEHTVPSAQVTGVNSNGEVNHMIHGSIQIETADNMVDHQTQKPTPSVHVTGVNGDSLPDTQCFGGQPSHSCDSYLGGVERQELRRRSTASPNEGETFQTTFFF
ncbi:Hypothetical predicted protein [Paramuricea clavata]|uniref:Uncharacterized protein n=1 Tax=Paramuricea clavata TaxID=317549 RepID=A0A7D9K0N8_PARCT|nr:Hypothetical predicted protein [Paramuricea clavata]